MKKTSITLDIVSFSKKGHGIGYHVEPARKFVYPIKPPFYRQFWPYLLACALRQATVDTTRVSKLTLRTGGKIINFLGHSSFRAASVFQDVKRTVEVPFTIPGDKVRALILRKRSGIYKSILEEILLPSPDRIEPRCLHFGICGGCVWQQIPYETQGLEKENRVKKAFASLLSSTVKMAPIIASSAPWQYRNKMEFSFSSTKQEQFLGLIMNGSKGKVFHLTECHLTRPWFVQALQAVKSWWSSSGLDAYHPFSNRGSLRTLTVREGMNTGDRMVYLTVSGNPEYALQKAHLTSFVDVLQKAVEPPEKGHLSLFVRIHQTKKGMPTQFYEMHLYGPDHIRESLTIQTIKDTEPVTFTFKVSPTAFFQPNTSQAEKLYSLALQLAGVSSESVIYDLYCGTGTLGICSARAVKQVIGVELSLESALDATENVKENHLENVTILTGDVGLTLHKILEEKNIPLPDVVLVDPPRSGLDTKAIQHLVALSPKTIVYISCNPTTQAENIEKIVQEGYHLVALQPVDQFPHTVHIENIALLHKKY